MAERLRLLRGHRPRFRRAAAAGEGALRGPRRLGDERQRAALAYADEATRKKRVSEPTFERLRAHFDERGVVEVTLAVATEHFYNLVNLPLEVPADGLEALAERRRA